VDSIAIAFVHLILETLQDSIGKMRRAYAFVTNESTQSLSHFHTYPGVFKTAYILPAVESGFKKMRFLGADSMVSCGQKADSCEKHV